MQVIAEQAPFLSTVHLQAGGAALCYHMMQRYPPGKSTPCGIRRAFNSEFAQRAGQPLRMAFEIHELAAKHRDDFIDRVREQKAPVKYRYFAIDFGNICPVEINSAHMTSVLDAPLIVNIDIVIPVGTPYPPAHMSQPPIFAFENLALQQGGGWLFQDIDLFIGARDRLALIGRNGAGKTTLMKLVAGSVEPDKGNRVVVPGTNIVMLEQDPDVTSFDRLVDFAIHGEKGPPEYLQGSSELNQPKMKHFC